MIGLIGIVFLAASVAGQTAYDIPPPTFDPQPYTQWTKSVEKSKLAIVNVPFVNSADGSEDNVGIYRLDLVGSTYERGYAHGYLLAKEIIQFAEFALNKYCIDAVMGIDLSEVPEPLREILHAVQIKIAAGLPATLDAALEWVYQSELQYIPSYLIEEMDAIGDGVCASLGAKCNATEVAAHVKRVNMFPELIRMACTAMGAWGKATPTGTLIQLRALDFGGGPFANYTVLATYRNPESTAQAFTSLTFPGFAGVITGVSEKGVGVSEKVWYNSEGSDPSGSYTGEPDVFVLRDILESSDSRTAAETYMQSVPRTWGIWVGVGDYSSQAMDIVGYQQASAVPYNDKTMPSMTNQPYYENLVYVDKHAQPSDDPSLPQVLGDHYGNITLESVPVVVQYHRTGDLHIAV